MLGNHMKGWRLTSVVMGCAGILSACAVGPGYKGPSSSISHAEQSPLFRRVGTVPTEVAQPPAAHWWVALDDSELTHLIETAFQNSPNVRAAQSRLRQARAALREQQRKELPTSSATAVLLKARTPDLSSLTGGSSNGDGGGHSTLSFYDVGFDATWELDIFGGTRRAIEAARAQAQASQADLDDLHVSLAAEVAQAYIELRDQQQRLALSRRSAEVEGQILDFTRQRRARGADSDADLEKLIVQLETTRGSLIPLQAQIDASLNSLAVLTGAEPGALDTELSEARPLPEVPAAVAIGDPASMLRRRPDIRAAERALAASNAKIGTEVANYFPKVNFLGDIGWGSTGTHGLLDSRNLTLVGAPILQWNVLDFGRTRARIVQAEGARDEDAAKYEATVLSALEDAETSLSRFGRQRESVVSLLRITTSANRSYTLTEQRYEAGVASMIDLLDSERTRIEAQQNEIQGRAQLVQNYASLQKSLGLGWE
jgi:NodT family efflux transporter outer membrane factor (OMF) lipoprotein